MTEDYTKEFVVLIVKNNGRKIAVEDLDEEESKELFEIMKSSNEVIGCMVLKIEHSVILEHKKIETVH